MHQIDLKAIKKMSIPEMEELAHHIREEIIDVTSQNGGHLSSNLGIVELTIALHYVFDSPHDKLIFDVSHQMYTHKLLTPRVCPFSSLRQYAGMSGFASRAESEHDVYEAGHSSTALSAAIGFSYAKINKPDTIGSIVAIVGDASITNGLSFEALNFLGNNPNHKVIIIINDNDMSISKNVGALAKTFNNIRIKRKMRTTHLRQRSVKNFWQRVKSSIKSYVYSNNIFNDLGFKYFEGIDGHDFQQLIKYLNYAKKCPHSIVLHVKTIKGRGYPFAEEDNTGIWHGVGPFDIVSGVPLNAPTPTYGECLAKHIGAEMVLLPNLYVITPGMTIGSGLQELKLKWPDRFIDVGIAEESAVVMAGAMSQNGLIPIVFMYSTFLQRAYDQLNHDVCRTDSQVILAIDRSGIVGGDGETHQGIFDIAILRSLPNMIISMPKDEVELAQLFSLALKTPHPFAIRYPKASPLVSSDNNNAIALGSWEWLNFVSDVVIISYGPDVWVIKQLLTAENLLDKVGLINARFIKPLDHQMLDMLNDNHAKIIVYEQVIKTSSLASAIIEYYSANNYHGCLQSMALPEAYLPTGSVEDLKSKYHLTMEDLLSKIKEIGN